jgi:hypothetical protein
VPEAALHPVADHRVADRLAHHETDAWRTIAVALSHGEMRDQGARTRPTARLDGVSE